MNSHGEDPVVKALNSVVPGGVRRGRLDRGGGRVLRWVEAGTGGPTVLLEAGGGDSAVRWAALLPRLAGLAHVVAYDRAGLGLSDPVRPLALQTQADDLIALIRHAGEGPCVLVGHSWGGELVQLAAFEVPELVAGLVRMRRFSAQCRAGISR